MDVYVIGVALHPAAGVIGDLRPEEMAYRTARAALDDAGIERRQIDHVTLAGSDEIDARGISSLLLAAPSGAYLKDEMRVTDSGLTGLHLGAMRAGAGDLRLALVVSWNQSSVGALEDIARLRAEPFFLRPIGLNFGIADGRFANAMARRGQAGARARQLRLRTADPRFRHHGKSVRMKAHSVAVIGVGQTAFRSRCDAKTYPELAQEAVALALADSGLHPAQIDAVVCSMAPTTFMGVADADKWAVDCAWARAKPFMRVQTGGATGGSALQAAYAHVASGQYGTVLVVGADRITETPDAQFVLNLIWDPFYEQDFALNTVTMTALATQRCMHKHGTTEEQYANVVVRARRQALNNPSAHLKGVIDIQAVMASPCISWPYKRLDICPRSAGTAAMVITNEALARERCTRPAFITGTAGVSTTVFRGDRMGPHADAGIADFAELKQAARARYRQAGIADSMREVLPSRSMPRSARSSFRSLNRWVSATAAMRSAAAPQRRGRIRHERRARGQPVGRHLVHQRDRRHQPGSRCRSGTPGHGPGRCDAG